MVSMGKIARHAVTVGLSLAVVCGSATTAFAAEPTKSGNGLVVGTYETFGITDGEQTSATTAGREGVQVTYSTVGGTWIDSGSDPEKDDDNATYPNGTFQVTVPKEIRYENMPVGEFTQTDSYDVWVRGVIPSDKSVRITATGNVTMVNPKAVDANDPGSQVTALVSWKRDYIENGNRVIHIGNYQDTDDSPTFTAQQVFGDPNGVTASDGGAIGSKSRDTVTIKGRTSTAGTWKGAITYTATLLDAK